MPHVNIKDTRVGVAATSDFSAVVAMLQDYFDGLYECDTTRFARVFHPEACYYSATDGELLHLDMPQYFRIIDKRPSPRSQGHVRSDRIRSIEFAGPVTAFATVECSIPGKAFVDFLTLVRLEGRWQIVSKVFQYEVRQ